MQLPSYTIRNSLEYLNNCSRSSSLYRSWLQQRVYSAAAKNALGTGLQEPQTSTSTCVFHGVAAGNLRKHAFACVCVRVRSTVYRARFAGNLALNSHRAAISRHSVGVASLLRATLTYVITRGICDHRRSSSLPFLSISQMTRTLN